MTNAAPVPLAGGHPSTPVDWWFAFKFNAETYPGEPKGADQREGMFGGTIEDYDDGVGNDARKYSQRFALATSADPMLRLGDGCIGTTLTDPLGATFGQVYDGDYYYAVWNDQLYGHPIHNKDAPWGHSKGLLAWNDAGEGLVLQVSTPSWPGSGSRAHPRQGDGNTLGYVNDDDIMVSQHFFALRLDAGDLVAVLEALVTARVATDPSIASLVRSGGPADVKALVARLGTHPAGAEAGVRQLSSGVELVCKPASAQVPPWQLVSAQLGGVDLRVASWWARPEIYSTTAGTPLGCWRNDLGTPGAVDIATTGTWDGNSIGLTGGTGDRYNHAKIGVSTDPDRPYSIFGDMNQQGALRPGYDEPNQTCASSQNGRGGLFYAVSDPTLHRQISALLAGESAATER